MNYTNPLRNNEQNYLREEDGKLFLGSDEIKEISQEEQKKSKTNANYVIEIKGETKLFCHLNKENKIFVIAETVSKESHDVWLKDMKSVTFYEGNIVLRDNKENKSDPFQKEEDISKLINQDYYFLQKPKEFVLFEDPIKEEKIAIQKDGDKWLRFNEELMPLTEEQKKISKTEANYAITNDKGTFLFKLDEVNKKFTLSETISFSHDVWLKDQKSISYHERNTLVVDHKNSKSRKAEDNEDLTSLINKSYKTFKEPSTIFNETKNIKKELGFLPGLIEDLNFMKEESISMQFAATAKDVISGKSFKKNKFLKVGAVAGIAALVVANPVAQTAAVGVAIIGTVLTMAAAFHTAIITTVYTTEFIGKKVKDMIIKPETFESEESDSKMKNMSEVKNSISSIRKDALVSATGEIKKTI